MLSFVLKIRFENFAAGCAAGLLFSSSILFSCTEAIDGVIAAVIVEDKFEVKVAVVIALCECELRSAWRCVELSVAIVADEFEVEVAGDEAFAKVAHNGTGSRKSGWPFLTNFSTCLNSST